MSNDNKIYSDQGVLTVFNEVAINSGADDTSGFIDLNDFQPNGFFTAQVETEGVGSILQLQYLISIDGITYVTPENKDGVPVDDIVTAHAAGSKIYPFYPVMGRYMKIYGAVSTANATSVTVKICIQ
jgi:hypothetical protein